MKVIQRVLSQVDDCGTRLACQIIPGFREAWEAGHVVYISCLAATPETPESIDSSALLPKGSAISGLGSSLVQRTIEHFRKLDFEYIVVEADHPGTGAIVEKAGFKGLYWIPYDGRIGPKEINDRQGKPKPWGSKFCVGKLGVAHHRSQSKL
jgi:hypothetical protein